MCERRLQAEKAAPLTHISQLPNGCDLLEQHEEKAQTKLNGSYLYFDISVIFYFYMYENTSKDKTSRLFFNVYVSSLTCSLHSQMVMS